MLAAVLALMALDEAVQVHEAMNAVGRRFNASGPFYYIGAFPYLLVAAALAVFLFRFSLEQSGRVKRGIAIGGLCYLAAAIGMEVLENILIDRGTSAFDARMAALFAVEELGEMFAAALLLRTFLVRFEELGGGRCWLLPASVRWSRSRSCLETLQPGKAVGRETRRRGRATRRHRR